MSNFTDLVQHTLLIITQCRVLNLSTNPTKKRWDSKHPLCFKASLKIQILKKNQSSKLVAWLSSLHIPKRIMLFSPATVLLYYFSHSANISLVQACSRCTFVLWNCQVLVPCFQAGFVDTWTRARYLCKYIGPHRMNSVSEHKYVHMYIPRLSFKNGQNLNLQTLALQLARMFKKSLAEKHCT
jgi:hypothetical protein